MAVPFSSVAALRPPKGLTARAVLFAAVLVIVTALVSAATIMFGADRESQRRQLSVTTHLTMNAVTTTSELIASGNVRELDRLVRIITDRPELVRMSVRDTQGRELVAHGGDAADARIANALAQRVARSGEASFEHAASGALVFGAPLLHGGQRLGVIVLVWDGSAYRYDAMAALAPFLLILACLVGAALLLTAHLVRRAVAPLGELARFAESVAGRGEKPAQLDIRSGDEFETLAQAFNAMLARLESSMRRIQQMAFVDPATQLPNQDRFRRELEFFLLRGNGKQGAVIVVELQRLPKLMNALDAAAARDLLRIVAERVAGAAQSVDRLVRLAEREGTLVAARLGATEFGVFAPDLASPDEAARFAQQLNALLNQPFDWRGAKLTLSACCGAAVAPRDGAGADAVIRRARMALAAAQNAPARVKIYSRSLDREAAARFNLEREMRNALERSEFRAFFQPKINLATGRIDSCEALARWVRPDRTIVSPGRFIPVAEESGLIGPLSDAIMREACWKAEAWARHGHPAKVAVNVSALQFRNERFAQGVLRVLEHSGLAPEKLELEITESTVMEDVERAVRVIKPLRDAGVSLAIDDFGCGHSSLAALSKLPFDVIKIDQQFMRALGGGDPQAPPIIEMILALARTLNMNVVAEGIERREEMEFVESRGCQWAQGFLFGAAISAGEFAELLRTQPFAARAAAAA